MASASGKNAAATAPATSRIPTSASRLGTNAPTATTATNTTDATDITLSAPTRSASGPYASCSVP